MSLRTRINKLEKSVKPGEEMELVIETIISDRREVLLGQAEAGPALGDRVFEQVVRATTLSR